jgi:hypothetical protein
MLLSVCICTRSALLRVNVAGRWISGRSSYVCNHVPGHCLLRFIVSPYCRGHVILRRNCAGRCRGNGLDLYSAAARFESWQEHHVYRHCFPWFAKMPEANQEIVLGLGNDRICPILSGLSPVCTTNTK